MSLKSSSHRTWLTPSYISLTIYLILLQLHHTKEYSSLEKWSPTLGLQMFLDYNSQKPSPPLMARISGSWSPRTSGGLRLRTTALEGVREIFQSQNVLKDKYYFQWVMQECLRSLEIKGWGCVPPHTHTSENHPSVIHHVLSILLLFSVFWCLIVWSHEWNTHWGHMCTEPWPQPQAQCWPSVFSRKFKSTSQ